MAEAQQMTGTAPPPPGGGKGPSLGEEMEDANIPKDFANQIAARIIVLFEKELDPMVAGKDASGFIYENTRSPKRLPYFLDATEILQEDEATEKFAALAWAALVINSDTEKQFDIYIDNLVAFILEGYYTMEKPEVQMKKKKFSGYASILGSLFIKMIEINTSLYDTLQEIYGKLIRQEMALDAKEQEGKEKDEKKPTLALKKAKKKRQLSKKLYDDIVDYAATIGEFKSTSLNEENPNEHIAILADRLRGTRRYVIQDIMNKRALERKKKLEKELSERLASAEEVIMAGEPFADGLSLFWREKRYNFKFLAVEKIRMALQVIGAILGVIYFMAGYLNLWGLHAIDGGFVCIGMLIFSRITGSRQRFKSFYPYDVSKELENCSTAFIQVMRQMSREQLEGFLLRQVKSKRNTSIIQIIPEFVKYLYAIMPDRKNMILTVDDLSGVVENLEIDIAKQLRGRL